MRVRQLRASLICIACALLVILLLNGVSQARIVPGRDPRKEVLQSSLIVVQLSESAIRDLQSTSLNLQSGGSEI